MADLRPRVRSAHAPDGPAGHERGVRRPGRAGAAAGQLWLAELTTVVKWAAPGGGDTLLFIVMFVTWFQAMSVLARAVGGGVLLARLSRLANRATGAVAITVAAAGLS